MGERLVQGYLLVEYLIYIAVLAVVLGVAFSGFYRCLENSRDLVRTTEDILRVLSAGERWRSDIRTATGSPTIREAGGLVACEIPQTNGPVAYLFDQGCVWRTEGESAPSQLLPRVKSSRMLKDPRQFVTSWRWEIELQSRKKIVRTRPLFTFQSVPAHALP